MIKKPILSNIEENRGEWLKLKQHAVGSSEIAAVVGLSPYKTAIQLYDDKLKNRQIEDNENMARGRERETIILEKFVGITGFAHKQPFAIYSYDETNTLLASPDSFLYEKVSKTYGICEVKSPQFFTAKNWDGVPPEMYQLQLQWQLGIIGLKWGYIAWEKGEDGPIESFRVEYDEPLFLDLVDKARKFIKCLQTSTPPYSYLPSDVEISAEALPIEMNKVFEEYERLSEKKKEIEELLKPVDNQLKNIKSELEMALGKCKNAISSDGRYKISLTEVVTPPKTVKGSSYFRLSIKKA